MEQVILLWRTNGRLPLTTSNLILNRKIQEDFRCHRVPTRSADDLITASNLAQVKRLARFPRARVCEIAAARNDIDLFLEARRQGFILRNSAKVACKLGHYELFKLILAEVSTDRLFADGEGYKLMKKAAKYGHVALLETLLQVTQLKLDFWHSNAQNDAATVFLSRAASHSILCFHQTYDLFCKLSKTPPTINMVKVCESACCLELIQELFPQFAPMWLPTPRACANAARRGDLDMLRWLREQGCNWFSSCTRKAAKYGHLELLKWAVENGCDLDEKALQRAAAAGQLKVVRWLLKINAPRPRDLLAYAARDSVEMMELCSSFIPFPIDPNCYLSNWELFRPYVAAAYRGDRRMLCWLEERNQVEMFDTVAEMAAIRGDYELAKELVARGSDLPDLDTVSLHEHKSLDFAQWLFDQNATCDQMDFFCFIALRCDLELLNWAGQHGLYPGKHYTQEFELDEEFYAAAKHWRKIGKEKEPKQEEVPD